MPAPPLANPIQPAAAFQPPCAPLLRRTHNTKTSPSPPPQTLFAQPPPPRQRPRRAPRTPHLAWLSGNPLADARVLAAARAASPSVLPTRGTPDHVLATARAAGVSTVHAHAVYAAPFLKLFAAAGLALCLTDVPAGVPAAGACLATAAAAPVLLETRDDSITRFFAGRTGELQEELQADVRTPWERVIAWLTRVYLPQGFPDTTTPDYISFTKYRTLQNLASAIMSVISTEALLFGLGLGKKVAAGAAATSWVLKDGASYVVKIGYGSIFGSKFDDDPKSWRIAADIVEDIGGAIEILTPLFPLSYFLPLASLAVCLRGMSLMTGTATRHVVYRSLAASGMQNTGDIATKGESQGVTMKMLGLGTGILVSSRIGQNYYALLAAYTALAGIHIVANWRSVQCVQFSFFNKQRASILIESHLKGEQLPNPYDVSHSERIVLPPWRGFEPVVKIGGRVTDAVASADQLKDAIRLFRGERFLIFTHNKGSKVRVLLRTKATSRDVLRAYYTVKKYLHCQDPSLDDLAESYHFMKRNIKLFEKKASEAGWDIRHMLLTDGQTRVSW